MYKNKVVGHPPEFLWSPRATRSCVFLHVAEGSVGHGGGGEGMV